MAEGNKKPTVKLNVNIPEHLRAGISSNIVSVTTSSNGIVMLDFVFAHPNDKNNEGQLGTLVARIILPTQVAQEVKMLLESQLGKIKSE